jgi:tetratricopeptide (TPR) repeat protein
VAPDITVDELDKEVIEELRSLPGDLADLVGRHLVAAERALEEDDPDRAHEHTKVARRFAARIGVVREAAGIVAYRAGHFSEALSDLRAARRMTGSDAYLPVMADCERGMGRPERAIDLVRSPEAERLDRAGRIELTIVESGARRDLGQHDAAVITLQRLPELRDPQPKPWSARLAFAYADALADAGHQDAATDWFGRAMAFDEDGETDAAERYAELTGAVIEDVEEDFDYEDDSDDADVAEAEVEDVATVDEEADDAAVLAEAGDLLDTEIAADDVEESSEEAEFGDEPDEGEYASASGASEADSAEGEGDDDSDVVTSPEEAAEAGETASAGKAEETAVETVETAETAEAGEQAAGVPGITPAFIEPNFGDVLDEGAESPADKAKKDED